MTFGNLSIWDLIWLGVYFVALALVVTFSSRHSGQDSEHYFLGGRSAPWYAIGLSLFASNIGTDHLLGLAGSGAAGGLAVGSYEFSACVVLLVLGWVFVPYYLAYEVFTVPEFLEKRFGTGLRIFFTWVTIFSTIFTKISVTIFAGAVVLQSILGWGILSSSIALLSLTTAYTVFGGLAAVIYTEVLQSVVLIVGSVALLYFGLCAAGGLGGLRERLPDTHFQLLKPIDHPDFPWTGVLFGMPINSIWYWCTDQVMVQRVLASDKPSVCQQGCLCAGWLKLLPMYIMVLPGLVAAALFPKEIEEDSNKAYALLVTQLLPEGWVGIMIAVMLSSFMAALASCFNSCSTLFTMDVYAELFPNQPQSRLVHVGRAFTVFTAALSLLWLPMVSSTHDQLFLYIQSAQVIWAGPVVAVFLGAILIPEMGSLAAWVALIAGIGSGLVFWILQNLVASDASGPALASIKHFNILHWSIVSLLFSGACLWISHRLFEDGSPSEHLPLLNRRLAPGERAVRAAAERAAARNGSRESLIKRISEQHWAGPRTKTAATALCLVVTALTIVPLG